MLAGSRSCQLRGVVGGSIRLRSSAASAGLWPRGVAAGISEPWGEPGDARLGVEPHRLAVLVDAVLAERREFDDQVDMGEDSLSQAGEHVFVNL